VVDILHPAAADKSVQDPVAPVVPAGKKPIPADKLVPARAVLAVSVDASPVVSVPDPEVPAVLVGASPAVSVPDPGLQAVPAASVFWPLEPVL